MDKGVRKSYFYNPAEKEKSSSSNDGNSSKGDAENTPQHKKEVNSWDRSTISSNREIRKVKTNDWDSGSECQETMVEPFDDNDNQKDWDSESEKNEPEDKGVQQPGFAGSVDSFDLSIGNFSDIVKSSESENGTGIEKTHREDSLLVEDFEEFVRYDTDRKSAKTDHSREFSEKVRSNESEGTPEDTTIWMIPNSARTQSRGSTGRLISSSDRQKIEKLEKITHFIKKTKSLSEVQTIKTRRRSARYARSEYSGWQKNNYNSFLLYEGSDLRRKLEIESEKTKASISGFDRTRVFFTEYECRTMTVSEDTPQKSSPSSRTDLNVPNDVANDNPESPSEINANGDEPSVDETGRAGPSSMDVVSLPDMIGRKSFKKRKQETCPREKERSEAENLKTRSWGGTQASESWLLLDDTGQYQTIPRNMVSIILNGKSADAVLQGRKHHFIHNITLKDTHGLRNSLSSMLEEETLQHVLKEDDLGGEDNRKRIIDLERKVENTLFYIQPGMNNTASVRIIPLDTEMIHIWRRTRDGGSALSLELDLMNSQDSVDAANQRNPIELHSGITRRPFVEETVSEEDEIQPADSTTVNRQMDPVLSGFHDNQVAEYAKLLTETRMIVDSLTNNFKVLQNRLDGETYQSKALQGEVKKLRVLLKNCGGKFVERNSGENIFDAQSVHLSPTSSPSVLILKENTELNSDSMMEGRFGDTESKLTLDVQDKSTSMEHVVEQEQDKTRVERNEFITVNIYAMESFTPAVNCEINPDSFSIAQSNLKMIEQQMKNLQEENGLVLRQNMELKRKLREISLELEKYLAGTSGEDTCVEEGRELETLRDQVCNLKLELENLKKWVRVQKKQFTEEKSLIEEESRKSIFSIKHWCATAGEILKKIETTNGKLQQNDIVLDANPEPGLQDDPEQFSNFLLRHIEETAGCMLKLKNENFLLEQTAREDLRKESKETSNLDQVISGYTELIEQCRKGQVTGETESKVMEDYFAVIVEKASLMEEIKILKTENEMLLEGQLEHYEKLKQTMIALKDRKSEISALESSQKLLEEERTGMTEVLKLCEEEKKTMEVEIMEKSKTIQDLVEEMKRKDLETADCNDRLNAALGEINNLEKTCRLKDELINELRMEHDDLLSTDGIKDDQIEILRNEITNLKVQGTHLEAELTSSKLFLNESRKEMTDYISHLEALVSSSQESLEKVKQKLKESNQTVNRLKSENDVLDKQHQCDVKLFNNTKDELDYCREKLVKVDRKLKESEEEREKLSAKCESLAGSEKEKSEALEMLTREYKAILGENAHLVEKVQVFSKDKDESLKDQKDLINKYAILSKEIQKLQDKYRAVKSECNERTDLIKYLEMMLRENLVEYNSRIACLEQNISRIIEKIVACKDGMKDKHSVVDSEVRELRRQLDVTHRERKEIENVVNNYYSLTKHLEREIHDREKKVEELHARLSLEQRKTSECGNETKPFPDGPDRFRIEQLERQIAETDGELTSCRKELQRCQTVYENEKKKLELTITDLKSEVKRYQLRIEVMMKNISNCNRNTNGLNTDKRNTDDSEMQSMRKELREKEKTITELKDTINKYKVEVKLKDEDLANSNKRGFYQGEELKNLQSQIDKMQDAMSTANKTTAVQQKERDEMAEKLMQSIKLIMEERSARQTVETLAVENEKNLRNQLDRVKDELVQKVKECEALSGALEEKKKLVSKLQDDLRKMKAEVSSLKGQVNNYKRNSEVGEEQLPNTSISLPHLKPQTASPERLESCLRELKEIRDLNLQLRKTEGQYQAKIVCLEDEIRDARLLIKELQGDIKTEKKSKKAFKNMITAAKMEIEKCVLGKQLMSVIAERISRHLDLSEIPSREFLSGFRISDSSSSSKYVPE